MTISIERTPHVYEEVLPLLDDSYNVFFCSGTGPFEGKEYFDNLSFLSLDCVGEPQVAQVFYPGADIIAFRLRGKAPYRSYYLIRLLGDKTQSPQSSLLFSFTIVNGAVKPSWNATISGSQFDALWCSSSNHDHVLIALAARVDEIISEVVD